MAREGIYVGGKEITQRYVGNKLVWEKWRLLHTFKTNSKASPVYNTKMWLLPFVPTTPLNGRFDAGDRGRILVKYSNYKGNGSFIVKKVYGYGYTEGYDGRIDYNNNAHINLAIEFNTEQEANAFNDAITSRTLLEIYN